VEVIGRRLKVSIRGGVSNTEDFSSYAFSLEGENANGIENLYYQLAYRDQDEGNADTGGERERGYQAYLFVLKSWKLFF
jgi:hypothetical protein